MIQSVFMTHPFLNNMCLTYPLILGVVFLSSIGEMIPQGRKYTPINSLTYSQIISQRDNATLKNFDSLSHKELILNFLTLLNLVADSVIGSQNSNDLIDKYLNNGFDDNMARRYRNYNSLNNFQENTHNDDLSPTHSIVRSIQVSSPRVPVSSSDLVTLEKLIYPGKETQKLTNQKVLKFGQYSNIEDRTKFQIVRPDPEKSVSIVKVRRKPLEQWEFFEYYFPKIINQIRSKWQLLFLYFEKPDAVPELITTTTVSPSSSPLPKPIAIQHAANFPLQSFLTTSSSLLFGVKAPTTSIIANPSNGLTSLNKMAIAFGLSLLPTFVILLPFIIPTNRSQRKVRKRRSVS
ncbi:unnamed protein product [Lepeophtheirus salmonis]|uniref:(salmon louse) hypothetical protein n=1 Tax=Lepeophtheirus salmonis TaxID=72036 RepID=A0A7R8H4J9_LEPSM|nr:unnamed protein product [Lepeophtheirus salmonis]CAF2861769.1 unnamed protein product [Lepeophtheirus salmonis]